MTATAKSQSPLFTRRALFTLIWPLLLEQTLSVTMGMADTLMVAGVGEARFSRRSRVFVRTSVSRRLLPRLPRSLVPRLL